MNKMESSREQSPVDDREEKVHTYERPEETSLDEQQQLSTRKQQEQHLLEIQHEKQQQLQEQRPPKETIIPHFVHEEETLGVTSISASASASVSDAAYEADVDDVDMLPTAVAIDKNKPDQVVTEVISLPPLSTQPRRQAEREHIYELFQPWALKNYGDQAKTKTITLRKKTRILKALEGKEHSRPDSSKFRFWVKTKAFTTKRPAGFAEAAGGHRQLEPLPPNAVLSDNASQVDLFVGSTTKDFGKRTYRKVAVVEEFFDIIYNVHMELGGRSGMHAGQKRTYRIITETYAFLPREAVTRFLSICPECKKNLRATSPATAHNPPDECGNDSSSEIEVLNYSSHTESSVEAAPARLSSTSGLKKATATTTSTKAIKAPTTCSTVVPLKRRYSQLEEAVDSTKFAPASQSIARALLTAPLRQRPAAPASLPRSSSTDTAAAVATHEAAVMPTITIDLVSESVASIVKPTPSPVVAQPKIRINPQLQRPLTPPPVSVSVSLPLPLPVSVSLSTSVSRAATTTTASAAPLVVREPVTHAPPPYLGYHPLCFDMNFLKTHESFFRYYEMMRRFYAGSFPLATPPLSAEFAEFAGFAEMLTAQRSSSSAEVGTMPTTSYGKQSTVTKELVTSESPSVYQNKSSLHPTEEPLMKKFKSSPESEKSYRPRCSKIDTQTHKDFPKTSHASSDTAVAASVSTAELETITEAAPLPSLSPPPTQLSAINLSTSSTCRSTRSNGTSTSHTKPPTSLPSIIIPKLLTPLTPLSSSTLSQLLTSTPTAQCSKAPLSKGSLSSELSFKSASTEMKASSSRFAASGGADRERPTISSPSTRFSSRLPPLDLERLKPITSTYLQLTRSMGLSDEDALRFDNLVSNDFNYTL
ncbi:mucin-5AC [Ceratitis capitata]|uniref:mucin-5AC n=1 Tax=Ceratitis capitata TaxID=7213 RepID=UPI000A0F5E1F|nr:mucin-5AC [Ceratitis capitata]